MLPDSVVNLIAAGEVVERPASVVKELVENALDAGATEVSVELSSGGRRSITVRDDGCGMDRHDLLLSVQRHATSKIAGRGDLDRLSTLGFRGEALPSIGAVSHLTVTTSPGGEAWRLRVDGGEMSDLSPAARERGTTVTVGSLFYNQPARKRFLRSVSTELSWVERLLTGCALSRTDVSFRLVHDGREIFSLPRGRTPEERLRDRFGLETDARCAKASGRAGDTGVSVVLFPGERFSRRGHQYVLVNGRLVTSGMVGGMLGARLAGPAGHPLALCSVTLPPGEVDVNVHPSKREVRFRRPGRVREAVEAALAALPGERAFGMRPTGEASTGAGGGPGALREPRERLSPSPDLFGAAMELQAPAGGGDDGAGTLESFPIVQLGRSYLVTATERGMVLVDQHAAHERILFESVLAALERDAGGDRQRLLLPENVRLEREMVERTEAHAGVLERAGFEYHMEGDTLVMTACPPGVIHGIAALLEAVRWLEDPEMEDMPVVERVAAAIACEGAVKFGDPLSPQETRHLVDSLFATRDPFHCPHGRPTLLEITYRELESRFGR